MIDAKPTYDSQSAKSDADKAEVARYIHRQSLMETERSNFESGWQDSYTYIVPRKQDVVNESAQGEKKGDELFDTTAIDANQKLAGMLHSTLTNQTLQFFELMFGDEEIDNDEEVMEWSQKVTKILHTIINNSNFQTEVHELYLDLGAIGMACQFIAEDKDLVVRFQTRAMREIYVKENNLGVVDTVHRKFKWTAQQLIDEFGEEKIPDSVKKKKDDVNEKFEILHVVEPRPSGLGGHMGFDSKYMLTAEKCIISRGGFKEFPYVCPRWTKTSGESYGRGPGQDALPEIKMLNKMRETTLKGGQKTVNPPLMVTDDGVIGKVRLTPGGLTIVRAGNEKPIMPLIMDARIDYGFQLIQQSRTTVRTIFFQDQFQLPKEGPQMTALEISSRRQESLLLMGPVVGRQYYEYLKPMVERSFACAARQGKIPEAPAKIRGKMFDVRYSSMVARAQRMADGTNFVRAMQVAAPIINMKPESADLINGDKSLKYVLNTYGVPTQVMNTTAEIKTLREGRAQANEKLAKEQEQQHTADLINKAGPTVVQAQAKE